MFTYFSHTEVLSIDESLSWESVQSKEPIYPLSKCDKFTLHSTLILQVSIGSKQHILKYMIY